MAPVAPHQVAICILLNLLSHSNIPVQRQMVHKDPHLIKLFKELRAGLVDGADDGATALGQRFQQRDHLEAGGTIQSAAEPGKERKCWSE